MTATLMPQTASPLHVHVGVATEHLATAVKAATALVDPSKVYLDGDCWEEWGEKVEPGEANHVVVEIATMDAARQVVTALEATGALRRSEDTFAILWAITDGENWSEVLDTDTSYAFTEA